MTLAMSAATPVATPAPARSTAAAAPAGPARPEIVGIRVDTERGPIDHTTFDRVSVLRDDLQWQYSKVADGASHETINQAWDGPYAQPKDPGDWSGSLRASDPAVRHLFDVATARAGELDGAPTDARTVGSGGSMTVTLLVRNADAAFPATRGTDFSGVTGAKAAGVTTVGWGANDDLFTPQAMRDIVAAAEAVSAAAHPAA